MQRRVGGYYADEADYDLGGVSCRPDTCLKMQLWNNLIGFANDCGLLLIFDVGLLMTLHESESISYLHEQALHDRFGFAIGA